MEFQEAPDEISHALAALRAAFPRFKLEAPTVGLYRDKLRRFEPQAVTQAVSSLIETSSKFPSLAELLAACRAQGTSSGPLFRSPLDRTTGEHEQLSVDERWMLDHAKRVLWRADFERRHAKVPPDLIDMDLAAEMVAHGVQITQDGARLRYDVQKILRPHECPTKRPQPQGRDWESIAAVAQKEQRDRMEAQLERNAIRREQA